MNYEITKVYEEVTSIKTGEKRLALLWVLQSVIAGEYLAKNTSEKAKRYSDAIEVVVRNIQEGLGLSKKEAENFYDAVTEKGEIPNKDWTKLLQTIPFLKEMDSICNEIVLIYVAYGCDADDTANAVRYLGYLPALPKNLTF